MINQDQPMLARRAIRLAVVAALNAEKVAQGYTVNISSPGVLPTTPDGFPALLVRAANDNKVSKGRTLPQFDTSVLIEIEGRIKAQTPELAQDQIEALGFFTETALFYNGALVEITQQFPSVATEVDINLEGREYVGAFFMRLNAECPEIFDPATDIPPASTFPVQYPPLTPVDSIDLHADTVAPFDTGGTYTGSPFPASVNPAPRSSGPDGRDEGGLDIPLTS